MSDQGRCFPGDRLPVGRLDLARHRYHGREVNPHVTNALLHLGLARRAARRRDRENAGREYARSLTCWQTADLQEGGRWGREVRLVRREWREVVSKGAAKADRGGGA
jgi:hypothetical protein